jgi:enoyl-CoA hydratase
MVSLEIVDQVAHIRLDRPDKLNAMNWDFWETLPKVVAEIDGNQAIRAVVLSAEGKAFSVGLDFF